MKSKAPLALIEQVLMMLVFAVTAAVCLRVFAYAETLSATNEYKAFAVNEVRSAAELLKAGSGDYAAAGEALKGSPADGGGFTLCYDAEKQRVESGGVLTLTVSPLFSPVNGLGRARVSFAFGEEPLFETEVSWQEVME